MRTIASFLGTSQFKKVEKLQSQKGLSKEERRQAEQRLLQPDKIPLYTGSVSKVANHDTVKLYFKTPGMEKLFRKYFKVTDYIETSCYRLEMLEDLLTALEEGTLKYDNESRKFKVRNREGSATMGSSEQKHVRRTR